MAVYNIIYGKSEDFDQGYTNATGTNTWDQVCGGGGSGGTRVQAAGATIRLGGRVNATSYDNFQGFISFDTSSLSGTPTAASVSLNISTASTQATDYHVRPFAFTTSAQLNYQGRTLLDALALHASGTAGTGTGRFLLTYADPTIIPVSSSYKLVAHDARQLTGGVAPTTTVQRIVGSADATGTTSDPFLKVDIGVPWSLVGVSNVVEVTATAHALVTTGIAGLQAGDLLVACIASRIASTTSITLPSGWTLVGEQKANNILSTSSALPSGLMAYAIRGGSDPALTFTHPVAPSVAIGRIVAYRGVDTTSPLDAASAFTSAITITAVSATGLTTTQIEDLIVAMAAGGQESAWSTFNATDPVGASAATDTTTVPTTTWIERADSLTTTGVDTSLAIFDAVKLTAGATGNFTATASVSSGQVVIAGAFKIAPSAPATLNVDGAQTTLAVSQSSTATVDLTVTGSQTTLEVLTSGTIGAIDERAVTGAQTTQAATTAATATTDIAVTTGTQTTQAVTQSATATTTLTVTGAQTTQATTQSGTIEANVPLNVTGSQTTSAATQTGTIAVRLVATAAQTLAPVLQTALVGVVPTVIGAQTTLAATTSATAATIYTVTGAQTTLAATQSGTIQTILPLAVTGSQTTLEAVTSVAATTRLAVTTGSQTTNATTQTSDLKVILAASATQTTLAAGHAATATTGIAVTGAQTLSATATIATVTTTNAVTGAQTTSATSQTSDLTLGPAFINVSGAQTTEAATQTLSVSLGAAFLTVTGNQTTLAATGTATVTTQFAVTGAQTTSPASTTGTLSAELDVDGAQSTNTATTSAIAATTATVTGAQTLTPATTAATVGVGIRVTGAQTLSPVTTTGTLTAPPDLTVTGAQTTNAATQTLSVSLGDPFLTVNGTQILPPPNLLAIASVRLVVEAAQTTETVRTDGNLDLDLGPPLNVSGFQAMEAALSSGTIGAVIPVTPEEGLPVAPGGPSRAAQRRLKKAIETRSRFEAERAKRLANLTNDRPLFVTPPETVEMINEVLVEEIDHSVLFEDEAAGEELLLLLWAA